MGYWPTPGQVIPLIESYLKRECEGLITVLDPCAGTGVAVKKIGDALQPETCGIEID